MLSNERMRIILQQIQLQSTVSVVELSERLKVSVDTVRRDLKTVEQEGLVKCVRGGACLPESVASVSNFRGREIIHSEEKREASRKAIAHIKEGDVVALNSGTTNTILAQEIAASCKNITVITNNLSAIGVLMQKPEIRLIAIGGMVDVTENSTYGSDCEREFAAYFPDLCFLSINAVNFKDGFTDFRLSELGVIRMLARQAKRVIAVMDSSKLGKRSKCKVLNLEEVDLLIMDGLVSREVREEYERRGLRIE